MPTYRLAIANLGTSGLGTVVTGLSDVFATVGVSRGGAPLRWTKVLNAPGSLEFTIPLDHSAVTQSNFAVGQREVHLYRRGDDLGDTEQLVWGGYLTSADVSGWAVRFAAQGWFSRLRKRMVTSDLIYENTSDLTIAWNLISHAQAATNGGMGITQGAASGSGATRTMVYCLEEEVVIADAIEELASAEDGFDFEITPAKAWKTYSPRRAASSGITLNAGTNVSDLSFSLDAEDLITQARIVPDSDGCVAPTPITASAGASTYGLLQTRVDRGENSASGFLQQLANEELRINGQPRFKASVQVDGELSSLGADDFNVGDTLTLVASRGTFANINRSCRVVGVSIDVKRYGREIINLELDGKV